MEKEDCAKCIYGVNVINTLDLMYDEMRNFSPYCTHHRWECSRGGKCRFIPRF